MIQRVRESKFGIIIVIVIMTVGVYGLCFSILNLLRDQEIEISVNGGKSEKVDEISRRKISNKMITFDEWISDFNTNCIIRSKPIEEMDEIVFLQHQEFTPDLCYLSIFVNIPWSEDYIMSESKKYQSLESSITNEIEDSYDKFFNGEKMIETNLEKIQKLKFGILLKLKVLSVNANVEAKDLKLAIENANKLFDNVLKQLEKAESETGVQSSSENLEYNEYQN